MRKLDEGIIAQTKKKRMKNGVKIILLKNTLFLAAAIVFLAAIFIEPRQLQSFMWPDSLLGTVSVTKNFVLSNFKLILSLQLSVIECLQNC